MTYFTGLRCVHCGREYHADEVDYFCPACGYHDGILDALYDYDSMRKEINPATLAGNGNRSMWALSAFASDSGSNADSSSAGGMDPIV